jgi:SAM-dependent methyltransferase
MDSLDERACDRGLMLHAYGLRLGIKFLRDRRSRRSLHYLWSPVNYWRALEYDYVFREGEFAPDQRVLDVGSPKLLSLYLATKAGACVVATDLDNYFVAEYDYLRRLEGLQPDRFRAQVEDGRQLSFTDESFERVYSISVVEHIPNDGDSRCLREIGRVLAPNGRALLTVPFARESRDVYRPADYVYWTRGSGAAREGLAFFERRYSEADLYRRLIEPSGLRLSRLDFVGERISSQSEREIWELMPWISKPFQPLLSKLLLTKPGPSWRSLKNPQLALLVLEKDSASARHAATGPTPIP